MTLMLELPDDIAEALAAQGDLSRRVLESFALEEFRRGRLTEARLKRLLGFETRYELDGFLKAHGIYIDYSIEVLEQERAALCDAGF